MNMMAGLLNLANRNNFLMICSLSLIPLLTKSEQEMVTNVSPTSVANALAKYDFPAPGGYNID